MLYSTATCRVLLMRTAALAISLYALILAVVAGATCGWDTTPVLVPAADGGEGYVCPLGGELYDTENPELGNTGVVCRNVFKEV